MRVFVCVRERGKERHAHVYLKRMFKLLVYNVVFLLLFLLIYTLQQAGNYCPPLRVCVSVCVWVCVNFYMYKTNNNNEK